VAIEKAAAEGGGTLANASDQDPRVFRAAVENSFGAVVITDTSGVIEYVNRSFEEITGHGASDLTGRDASLLSPDDDIDQSIRAALTAGDGWRGEIKNRRADGQEYCLLASIQPLRSDGGKITHYIGVYIDITERVKVEEELAEREAFWRALVENAPDQILAVDKDGVIQSLNWTVRGATVHEAVSPTVFDFVREEYHDAWREALAKVFAGERRVEVEARTIGGSEDSQWYANMLGPVYAGDTVVAAVVSSRNVTARKKAEEELAEREAYWRALVENAPDHILTVDKDGVITSLNWSGPGIEVDDVVGGTVYDWTHEEYHDAWREGLAEVFGGGQRVEFEVRTFEVTGQAQWYVNTLSAVRDGDTVVAGIAIIRDITALKEAEERMRAIASAIADIVIVVDEDGLILEVLAPTDREEFLGLPPPEDLRGRHVQEFLPHDQAERALELVRQTVSSGRPGHGKLLLDMPQGPTWLSARSAPLSLGGGRIAAVVHILDISEQKRLEEELQRLREEAEEQAEAGMARAAEYGLTFREITVLSLIARGKSDKEIAMLLGLSPFTVNKHSANLVRKLGARSRSQAAALAVREGII
jgi:PAS domain S-box-containing protein